jgi:hypothetical protein
MSNVYSLDALRQDLDREFAPLKLEVGGDEIVLRNLLRIGEKERSTVLAALKAVEESQAGEESSVADLDEIAKHVETILQTVTADGNGKKLVTGLGGDMALAMKVVELWVEATQPGEAENSPA